LELERIVAESIDAWNVNDWERMEALVTGEASGLATTIDVWWVNEVRDGLLRSAVSFLTDEESARNEFRAGGVA
jgi:hypothetical protein